MKNTPLVLNTQVAYAMIRISRVIGLGLVCILCFGCISSVDLRAEPGSTVAGQTTPVDFALVEERELLITCVLSKPPVLQGVPVLKTGEPKNMPGTYHYKLWLPKGYLADSKRSWPTCFIASPGGNAGMGKMAEWLKANGYIVVMLVESKNGPWAPIIGNFIAAHDDVVQRVRVAAGRKIATGFSGGARASSLFVQLRPGFGGLILQGAGAVFDDKNDYVMSSQARGLKTIMLMGNKDSNQAEVATMKKTFRDLSVISFEGGHTWAPQSQIEQALDLVHAKRG